MSLSGGKERAITRMFDWGGLLARSSQKARLMLADGQGQPAIQALT